MTPLRTIETDALFVHELEADVHYVVMKNKAISRTVFQEMFEAHLTLSNEEKVFVISDNSKIKSMNIEAMRFAKNHGNQICHALILVNSNKITRTLSDFFIRVVKPSIPTKLVKDFESALSLVEELKKDKQTYGA